MGVVLLQTKTNVEITINFPSNSSTPFEGSRPLLRDPHA